MATHLALSPNIYSPCVKEPFYFGSDFTRPNAPQSPESYLSLYEDWKEEKYSLDASTQYIYSETAAREIHAVSPTAKIIVMIRNPVDACYSMFLENRFEGIEPMADFESAFAAQQTRQLKSFKPHRGFVEQLLYTRIFSFSENIQRFQNVFGENGVELVFLEDLLSSPADSLARVWNFLSIDPPPSEPARLAVKNTSKTSYFPSVNALVTHTPPWAGRWSAWLLNKQQRRKIITTIVRLNTRGFRPPEMSEEIRAKVCRHFHDEVERLSELAGRDLTHWQSTAKTTVER